jgi:Fur family peroxide stress response transcriptional regulator
LTANTGCNKIPTVKLQRLRDRARPKLEELARICREHGLPLTVQRRMILEALSLRKDHPTADEVFGDVRERMPEISRTTVYRVLETLVRIAVARKVCHPAAVARYEMEADRHHHLVCLNCEKMVDLRDTSLDNLPLPGVNSGFNIEDYSIQFRGLCSDCAAESSTRRARKASSAAPAAKPRPAK